MYHAGSNEDLSPQPGQPDGVFEERHSRRKYRSRGLDHIQRFRARSAGVRTKQRFVSLSRQRGQAEDRKILLYRLRREVFVHEREPCDAAAFHLHIPDLF